MALGYDNDCSKMHNMRLVINYLNFHCLLYGYILYGKISLFYKVIC